MCVPIVTLGMGCLKERVEHNVTGFIANTYEEFAKYTLQLFEDDKLWMYFRDNLKKKRGRWKWINTAFQIKKIIQK
jgi:glycosyltransferase involved in cell wall biosynthesis